MKASDKMVWGGSLAGAEDFVMPESQVFLSSSVVLVSCVLFSTGAWITVDIAKRA